MDYKWKRKHNNVTYKLIDYMFDQEGATIVKVMWNLWIFSLHVKSKIEVMKKIYEARG